MTKKKRPKKSQDIETPWEAAKELGRLTESGLLGLISGAKSVKDVSTGKGMKMMTTKHKHWQIFWNKLHGPLGCNFRKDDKGETVWTCKHDHHSTRKILAMMGYNPEQIEKTLAYYREEGGYCDCEILFNVKAEERKT